MCGRTSPFRDKALAFYYTSRSNRKASWLPFLWIDLRASLAAANADTWATSWGAEPRGLSADDFKRVRAVHRGRSA